MKSIRLNILVLLVASSVGLMAQAPEQQAWVIERDIKGNMWYLIGLDPLGGPFVPTLPIKPTGNSYELYARGTAWDENVYLLDTKLIKAYSPAAAFWIDTGDTYIRGDVATGRYVKRMRADKMYTIKIDVTGLVADSTNPAEKSAYFAVHGTNYDTETYSGLEEDEYEIFAEDVTNGSIGPETLEHELTLPANKKYSCGEMKFTMVRRAADGVPDTIIAQPKIEIWPMATAVIENITQNQVFIDRIPQVLFRYKDLYPDSRTYVQIYEGPEAPASAKKQGTIVDTTERRMGKFYNPLIPEEPAAVPQNEAVAVNALSNYTPKDGIYTVEIITQTPYARDYERLAAVTFEVDYVISSRGKLSTAEGATTTTP